MSRCASTSWSRRRSRRCAPGRRAQRALTERVQAALPPVRGEPREAPARPLQPDPERDPPHAGRRQRDARAPTRGDGRSRSRSPTPATGSRPPTRARVFERFYRGGDDALAARRRRRPRPGDLPRDRRGARRPHLARESGRAGGAAGVHRAGACSGSRPSRLIRPMLPPCAARCGAARCPPPARGPTRRRYRGWSFIEPWSRCCAPSPSSTGSIALAALALLGLAREQARRWR